MKTEEKKPLKLITIFGTRPEIVKLSPLLPLLDAAFDHKIVHTGQHYDYNMDEIFFEQLNLRKPDYNLAVGSASHAQQTTKMMIELEKIFEEEKPDAVIACTDTNSPLATAIVAAKMQIPVIHFEAGCRSYNKKMPEEINRVVADHCSTLHLAPDDKAKENLLREGFSLESITVVGSTAIEASIRNKEFANKSKILDELAVLAHEYIVATIHRAENTNDKKVLEGIVQAINQISTEKRVICPVHPRTQKKMREYNLEFSSSETLIEPIGYLDFLQLISNSFCIITDSGGIQEEAAAVNVPCLVVRNETEWTYLIEAKKNFLLGTSKEVIVEFARSIIQDPQKYQEIRGRKLPLATDASQKIRDVIKKWWEK